MDCAYHSGVAAVGYCSSCGRPACKWCLQSVEGRSVCPTCASAAPAPQPPAAATPSPPRRSNTGKVVGLACGGVILLFVLIAGTIMGYRYYTSSLAQNEQQAQQGAGKLVNTTPKEPASDKPAEPSSPAAAAQPAAAQPAAAQPAAAQPAAAQPAAAKPAAAAPQPGEQRAVDAALQGESSWQWRIKYHTDDWQRAKIWIGPSASRITTEVILQWKSSSNTYAIERKGAIPRAAAPKPSRRRPTSRTRSGGDIDRYDKDGYLYHPGQGQNF